MVKMKASFTQLGKGSQHAIFDKLCLKHMHLTPLDPLSLDHARPETHWRVACEMVMPAIWNMSHWLMHVWLGAQTVPKM